MEKEKLIDTVKRMYEESIRSCTDSEKVFCMQEIENNVKSGKHFATINSIQGNKQINITAAQKWLKSEGFKTKNYGFYIKVWGWIPEEDAPEEDAPDTIVPNKMYDKMYDLKNNYTKKY